MGRATCCHTECWQVATDTRSMRVGRLQSDASDWQSPRHQQQPAPEGTQQQGGGPEPARVESGLLAHLSARCSWWQQSLKIGELSTQSVEGLGRLLIQLQNMAPRVDRPQRLDGAVAGLSELATSAWRLSGAKLRAQGIRCSGLQ
jgi:hypothetical protein